MDSIGAVNIPPAADFRGWSRWRQALPYLVVAAGAGFFVFIFVVAVPRDVVAMMVLAGYTLLAMMSYLAVGVALLLTRQLPTAEETTLDGEPAVVVRAWRGDWWLDQVVDTGLGTLGLTLGVLGLVAGGDWVPWSVLVMVAGAWFLARVGLALAGQRRNEALWLTADEVVHDTSWGRERCARSDVDRVRQVSGRPRLLIVAEKPVTRQLCPRPWRQQRVRVRDDDMGVDCSLMGHDVDELARWLQATIPAGGRRGGAYAQ